MLYRTRNPHGGDVYGNPAALDFSGNTNPYGTPPGVVAAIQAALPQVHQYPDPYCRQLIQAISDHESVSSQYLLCGNGAAELIYSYCAAVRPRVAVELAPTFSEYARGLRRTGCEVRRYPLRAEHQFVLDGGFLSFLREEAPEAVFLCNPNNPTGQVVEPHLLREILRWTGRHRVRLFLDECFLDLADRGESLSPLLRDNPHLFLLKAFTKSYGLAGVRLGYGMSSDRELLGRMSETVQPWNVSLLAQAAGTAALREQAFLQTTRQTIRAERQWLYDQLEGMGLTVYPSHANYLLFYGPAHLHVGLRERGIAIRSCDNFPGLGPGWYRIAVRLRRENECLVRAMGQVLEAG